MSLYEGAWLTGADDTLVEGAATNSHDGVLTEGQWVVDGLTPVFREGRVFYGDPPYVLSEGASTGEVPASSVFPLTFTFTFA